MIIRLKLYLAIRFRFLRKYILSQKQIENLESLELRAMLKYFGCDTDDLTDTDIKEGLTDFGKIISKAGLATEEAIYIHYRFANLAEALKLNPQY